MAEDDKGASNNERLLAAARTDNEDLLLEIFNAGDFDINCEDGLGNTSLHLAAQNGSTDVIEHILSHEYCDVDPINKIAKATPLHLAVQLEPPELRVIVVESLLDAGADIFVKDKNGDTALDLSKSDKHLVDLFRKAQVKASISKDDIASDGDDETDSGTGD